MKVAVHGLSLLPPSARKSGAIASVCRRALKLVGARVDGELNVIILSREAMRALNKRYLDHSHDTDVIAFNLEPGSPKETFGEVYISAYQARRQADEQEHSVLREVLILAAHGTLHLLGYDDATPRQKAEMFRLQDKLVGKR